MGSWGLSWTALPSLHGDFVVIVDADDTLFWNFVSAHVQVHLALMHNAALTSSNLVEVDSMGRALTGHYELLNHSRLPPSGMGLRRIGNALRIPLISDSHYHELARWVDYYKSGGGWLWGPGSSTMYRRSVIELARYSHPRSDVDASS